MNTKTLACLSLLILLGGCASAPVQRGALYGALSGGAVGAGLGYVLSEPDLLGSSDHGAGGDTSLPVGNSTLAGAGIGLLVGAIVGAMVGHQRENPYEQPPKPEVPPADTEPQAQARPAYLRGM